MEIDLNKIPKFVINLPDRTDRLQSFNKEFFSFFNHGDSYKVIRASRIDPGYVGCAMSHLSAVNAAFSTICDHALIMEDDCVFNGQTSRKYAELCMKNLPEDFDLVQGGLYFRRKSEKTHGEWEELTKFSGSHFYIVSRKGMFKLSKFNCDTHIDHWMGLNLKCYAPKKFFAMQEPGYSDIANKPVDYTDRLKEFVIV